MHRARPAFARSFPGPTTGCCCAPRTGRRTNERSLPAAEPEAKLGAMVAKRPRTPRRAVPRRTGLRALELTAAYCPASEGGYTVEILEAVGVHSQGDTFDEARRNLHEVVALMLEEAPQQFGARLASPPPGALLEKLFVLVPLEAA